MCNLLFKAFLGILVQLIVQLSGLVKHTGEEGNGAFLRHLPSNDRPADLYEYMVGIMHSINNLTLLT